MESSLTYRDIMKELNDRGFQAYLVGGAVRDSYAGKVPKDFDVVTDALPDQITEIFQDSKVINAAFSVSVYVKTDDTAGHVEVTTMREEDDADYLNGRPTKYTFTKDLIKDLSRRDATCNAIAIDYNGDVIDPFNGRGHMAKNVIVAIGNPVARIIAHPIRIMRYARMAASFPDALFILDKDLVTAITNNKKHLVKESWDAIGTEFMKGLATPHVEKYILTLRHLGILDIILPEITAMVGIKQNIHHDFDSVWVHTLRCLRKGNELGLSALEMLGVLVHDIGKPHTAEYKDESYGYTFYGHDTAGALFAADVCNRLRLSVKERQLVTLAVRTHMYDITGPTSAKRFLRKMDIGGNSTISEIAERATFVMDVMLADALSRASGTRRAEKTMEAYKTVTDILSQDVPFSIKNLSVNGVDVMDALGIDPGKRVGEVLSGLLEAVVSNTVSNDKEELLDYAKRTFMAQATAVA